MKEWTHVPKEIQQNWEHLELEEQGKKEQREYLINTYFPSADIRWRQKALLAYLSWEADSEKS